MIVGLRTRYSRAVAGNEVETHDIRLIEDFLQWRVCVVIRLDVVNHKMQSSAVCHECHCEIDSFVHVCSQGYYTLTDDVADRTYTKPLTTASAEPANKMRYVGALPPAPVVGTPGVAVVGVACVMSCPVVGSYVCACATPTL